jgi:hypothetical protein
MLHGVVRLTGTDVFTEFDAIFGEFNFLHPFCGEILGWYQVPVEMLALVSQTTRYQFSEHHNFYTVCCRLSNIVYFALLGICSFMRMK